MQGHHCGKGNLKTASPTPWPTDHLPAKLVALFLACFYCGSPCPTYVLCTVSTFILWGLMQQALTLGLVFSG